MTAIEDLADYPALLQLARALWRDGSVRGAALLVGAGFSRNAVRPGQDTPAPPLWRDLERDLVKDLYRNNPEKAPKSPVRVAEEYRTFFGQAALDDFIRTRFPDKAWLPGSLHQELLTLPWSDVLTTNWDTILERASDNVNEISWEVVRHEDDLPYARSPRIVKLHGSIGDKGPLTFAEEDYRKYPTEHAAFVNLARQVFIENELCLLGFSGDDPNFLQWAGWVRDQLGGSARRIYLVGNLDLQAATRRFFESHNIQPIDFAPYLRALSVDDPHAEASRKFFEILRLAKPHPAHEWRLAEHSKYPLYQNGLELSERVRKDDEVAKDVVQKTTALLAQDRKCYPGWLICPHEDRQRLQHGGAEQWVWRKSVLDLFTPSQRADVLYEIVWRRNIALQPIEHNIEVAAGELLTGDLTDISPDIVGELALALMRDARLSDRSDAIETWGQFIERKVPGTSPLHLEVLYQRCLRARDIADFRALAELLKQITSDEPEWELRRAALSAEIGRMTDAVRLITSATEELNKRYRLDRSSLWIKSRLGWADYLSHFTDVMSLRRWADSPQQKDFDEAKIEPFEEIQYIQKEGEREEARQREEARAIIPSFQAGYYKDNTRSVSFRNSPVVYRMEADQLIERVGLPLHLPNVNLCGPMAIAVAKASMQPSLYWYIWLLRGVSSESDPAFSKFFGRVAMARLPSAVAHSLISTVRSAIAYWLDAMRSSTSPDIRNDLSQATDVTALYLTALAHLTVRMNEEEAVTTLKMGLELARERQFWSPSQLKAIENIVTYSVESISKPRLGELAIDFIEFPLAIERGRDGREDRFYPRVVTTIWRIPPARRDSDQRWAHRIEQLIEAARGGPSREDAILRLTYLSDHDALLEGERARFGEALWAIVDDNPNPLPAGAALLHSVFLTLPAPQGVDLTAVVKTRVIDEDLANILEIPAPLNSAVLADKLNQLSNLQNTKALGGLLTPDWAARTFDQLVTWRPTEARADDPFRSPMIGGFNDSLRTRIGEILGFSIIPKMVPADLTEARGRALLDFIVATRTWRAGAGLPQFALATPALEIDIVIALRRWILGNDDIQVASAAKAASVWAEMAIDGNRRTEMPRALVERVYGAIESRQVHGLHTILNAAITLIRAGFYEYGDLERLALVLSDLRAEFDYNAIDEEGFVAVSISLIRAECVDLARELLKYISSPVLQLWMDEAKNDPLPEVRFKASGILGAEADAPG